MPAPRFGKHCYFSEGVAIIGDVEMGDDCTVWFNAVIRGDVHFIKIGNRTNIPDELKGKVNFPKNDSQYKHFMRDEDGHLPDTPENRKLLTDLANDTAYHMGKDKYGND